MPRQQAGASLSIATTHQGLPVEGASCTASTGSTQLTLTTPGSIIIAPQGDLRIVCERSGYSRTEYLQPLLPPPPPTSNTTVGLSIGGVSGNVGLGLGTVFPLRTGPRGGVYPSRITIELPLAP